MTHHQYKAKLGMVEPPSFGPNVARHITRNLVNHTSQNRMALVLYSKLEEAQRRCWILGTIVDEHETLAACCSYLISMEQMVTIDIISQRREDGSLTIDSAYVSGAIATARTTTLPPSDSPSSNRPPRALATIAELPSELLSLIRSYIFQMTFISVLPQIYAVSREKEYGPTVIEPELNAQPDDVAPKIIQSIWQNRKPNWTDILKVRLIPGFMKQRKASEIVNACLARLGCTALFDRMGGNPIGPQPLVITHLPLPDNGGRVNLSQRLRRSGFSLLSSLKQYHELPFPSHREIQVYENMLLKLKLSPMEPERRVPTALCVPSDVVYDLMYLPSQ